MNGLNINYFEVQSVLDGGSEVEDVSLSFLLFHTLNELDKTILKQRLVDENHFDLEHIS